nr:MAG TPA: tail tape measure protein [Caudoviricetes sp.]
MGDLGKLWFSLGLKDETDKDYDKVKKRIEEKLKKELEIKVRPSIDVDDIVNGDKKRLNMLGKIQNALYRIDTLENKIRMNSKFSGGGQGYDEALRKIERLRTSINSLNKSDVGAVNSATGGGLTYQLNTIRLLAQEQDKLNNIQRRNDARRLADSTRLAAQEQKNLAKFTGEANNKLSGQSRIASEVKNQISGYLSIYAAERFLGSIIQIGGEFEKQKIALRSILGDVSKAETIFSQIKTLAVKSPFEFKDLASYAKQLSAFAIPYEELYDTTKRLADISAGLGVDMGRIILAYGQVRSAAFLRGQEVRQFTEAGIPLIDELAKKFTQLEGNVVSAGEVFDRISKRMVSFEMVKEVLWDLTNEGGKFYNMQEELAESLAGKWANLRDSYGIMLSEIAEGNNGPLKASIEMLTSLMNNWRGVSSVIGSLVVTYGTYKAAVAIANTIDAVQIIRKQGLAIATQRAAAAMVAETAAATNMNAATAVTIGRINKLKGVLSSVGKGGWIGLVIGAVISLSGYLYSSYREATRLRRELDDIGDKADSSVTVAVAGYKNLSDQLEKTNVGSKERLDIINQINTRYGEYLPNLWKEADSNDQIAASIDRVTEAIKRRMQAQAYEQGLQKIEEEYAKDIKEKADYLAERAMSVFDADKSMAKKFIQDLTFRIKPEMDDYELQKLLRETVERYDFSTEKMYNPSLGRKPFYKEIGDYNDLLKEQKQAEEDFARSIDKRYEGLGLYEDKLREIEERYNKTMPSDPDKARTHQVDMLTEQLKVLSNADDEYTKKYIANINARIVELSKESDEWVKTAERLSREEMSVGGRKITTNFLAPKDEEKANVIKYLERVGEEYENIKKEIEKIEKLPQSLLGDQQENLAILKFQKKQYNLFGKSFGVDLTAYSKSGLKEINKQEKNDLKDAVQLMKEEVELVARRWELYRKLYDLTGNREGAMMSAFGGNVSFKSEVEELREKLRNEIKASGKKVTIEELLGMSDRQLGEYGNLSPIVKKIKEATSKLSEEDMMDAAKLINKYRDYEEKIVEIKRKANDDIRKLEEQRAKFGDEATDRAIAKRQREERTDILKTKFDQFKNSPEYLRAFGDLSKTSSGTLQFLLEQLEKFQSEAANTFDPAVMKEYVRIIESVAEELRERDPFKALKNSIDEVNVATTRLHQARNTVKFVQSGENKVISEADAMKELNEATDNYLDKTTKMKKAMASVAGVVDNFSSSLKDLGGSIGGTAGEVMSLIGDIGRFATESIQGVMNSIEAMKVAATAGAQAMAAIETASVILRVISAAMQVVDKIKGWLSGGEDRERYQRWLQTIVDTQDAYNQKLVETKLLQEDVWGTKQIANALNAIQALDDATENYNNKLNEQQKAWKDPKSKWRWWGGVVTNSVLNSVSREDSEYVALKDNLRYITKTRKKGFLGIGGRHTKTQDLVQWVKENMDGAELFFADGRLNLTVAESLLENADNLAGETENNLRKLVELEKQIQEAEKAISEYISETFGSLADSLSNSIVDAFRNGTDAAKSFRDSVVEVLEDVGEQILKNTFMQGMFSTYQEKIKKAYESYGELGGGQTGNAFVDAIANALLSGEIADATEELAKDSEKATEQGEKFLEMYKNIMGNHGFDVFGKDTNTPSLGKSVQSLTEDTGNLIASYFNATRADVSVIKMHMEKLMNETYPSMNLIAEAQLTQLTQIQLNTANNVQVLTEFRDLFRRATTPGSGVKVNM